MNRRPKNFGSETMMPPPYRDMPIGRIDGGIVDRFDFARFAVEEHSVLWVDLFSGLVEEWH